MKRQPAEERGATLVEFALILPILMALILGMFTGGIAYNRKITITDAVREGARYGATLEGGVANETAWATNVTNRVVSLSAGELAAGDVCVDLIPKNTAPTDPSLRCPGAPGPQNERTVYVRASRQAKLEAFFFSIDLTLQSSSFGRYEREPTS